MNTVNARIVQQRGRLPRPPATHRSMIQEQITMNTTAHVDPALIDTGAFAYTFTADGTAIENPWLSDCGRFEVDPSFYGFVASGDALGTWLREFTLDGKPVLMAVWKSGEQEYARVAYADEPTVSLAEWSLQYDENEGRYLQLPLDPVKRLAVLFGVEIRQYLSPAELRQANRDNAAETDPGVCHTHDHCDANMAMLEAFERQHGRPLFDDEDVGAGRCTEAQQQADCVLWGAAWALAATNKFWAV